MIRIKRKPRAEALLQILILVIGLVAISYAVGSSVEVVGAEGSPCPNGDEDCKNIICAKPNHEPYCNEEDVCDCKPVEESQDEGVTVDTYKGGSTDVSSAQDPVEDKLEVTLKDAATLFNMVPQDLKDTVLDDFKDFFTKEEIIKVAEELEPKPVKPKFLIRAFGKGTWGGWTVRTAAWAATLYFGIKYLGTVITDDPNIQRAFDRAAAGASIGSTAGRLIGQIVAKKAVAASLEKVLGISVAAIVPVFGWIATGVGIIISILTFKNERYQQITFQCNAWQAETGGENCEECNDQGLLPCTEYQCKSLGQGCGLINPGTGQEKCTNVLCRSDAKYPIIDVWIDALLNNDYRYSPASAISPPDRGAYVKYIKSGDGCVPAFTPLSFGVMLDEPARCKISPIRTNSFETMGNLFLSGGLADYNHSFSLSMPGSSALGSENISIENDGNYELYVMCEDSCGNANPANFVFKYCVDPEPDHTNPLIVSADPLNGLPVGHDIDSIDATIYVNEPAECRWSHLNQDYENMENTMSCATSVLEMNAYMLYPCTTTLTGIQNNVENKFYFRCKDQPFATEQRNTNTESYEYLLIGTEPLILDWVTPNDTLVKGPTSSVKVTIEAETSAGYKDGISTCYYSETEEEGSYIQFYNTHSYEHSQDLWLSQGEYDYYIKCMDLGGNTDRAMINFEVETDTSAPIISRVYYEDGYLKIITDEEAKCVYGNANCKYNFDEGISMISIDDFEHSVSWNSDANFYIKCGEIREGGIYPSQNQCSLEVRPFDIYSG